MSYILEALRRADNERDQGRVPGLHSQAQLPRVQPAAHEAHGRSPLFWGGLGAAVVVLGGLAWALLGGQAALPPPPPIASAQPMQAQPLPAAPQPPQPTPQAMGLPRQGAVPGGPAPAPAPSAHASPAARPLPTPVPPATKQMPIQPVPAPAQAAAPLPVPATRPAPAALRMDAPVPAASTPSAPAPAPAMPEELRRQLGLQVTGSIYSELPADRMLIINGQLLRERDKLAEGITLERINPKSAVLNVRGQRYTMGF